MVAHSLIVAGLALGFLQGGPAPKVKNPGLAMLLAKMVKVDQDFRLALAQSMKEGKRLDPRQMEQMRWIDAENTGRMRAIVDTYGWPTFDLVGPKGGNDAWLLVQHADHDPKFQRRCLDLMAPWVPRGQVGKQNFAYLTDRVLVAEGKKQLYGTQFIRQKDGSWTPNPIEDPENVDKRRLEMGMSTLAEYRKGLEELYGTKPPPASK